jgi:hypothetical protein
MWECDRNRPGDEELESLYTACSDALDLPAQQAIAAKVRALETLRACRWRRA